MSIRIIIGKNFGDEGKGLATDYFASKARKKSASCIVVRHNGGAQAGHTVDFPDKRFVFHQLSSGSFRGADTYWAQTFLPDLYKLEEETEAFRGICKNPPTIYAHPMCRCVYIDDVLVNMALETFRGDQRHGSCGMGINEAVLRSAIPEYCLHLGKIVNITITELYDKLLKLRLEYLPQRLEALGLSYDQLGEYRDLLTDNNVLFNAAEQMHKAVRMINVVGDDVVRGYDNVIFEGAQGLLLDEDHLEFAPHLTSSKTDSDTPMKFLRNNMPDAIPEIVYVTRSYVTRHGAGPLPHECEWEPYGITVNDMTNVANDWQGFLRFAPHGTIEEFAAPPISDIKKHTQNYKVSYMVTHLNETQGSICSTVGKIPVKQWFELLSEQISVDGIYLSYTPYSDDICYIKATKE